MGIGTRPKVVDVSIQDNTNPVVYSYAIRELATTLSLAANATIGSTSVTLNAGHGFLDPASTSGQVLAIPGYYVGEVIGVAGNIITLSMPIGYNFTSGTAVTRGSKLLNVDGSGTDIVFGIAAVNGRIFDITGFTLVLMSASPMDDSLFGSLAKLAKGLTCRIRRSTTWYNNVFNARNNQDLNAIGELSYSSKAPSGKYGLSFYFDFKNYGTTCRLIGAQNQRLEFLVRDALGTLEDMQILIHGHVSDDIAAKETTQISITDTWTPISAAGESISIWTFSNTPILVTSSLTGSPTAYNAYPIKRIEYDKPLELYPDDPAEIFYAKCLSTGATETIKVDYL